MDLAQADNRQVEADKQDQVLVDKQDQVEADKQDQVEADKQDQVEVDKMQKVVIRTELVAIRTEICKEHSDPKQLTVL